MHTGFTKFLDSRFHILTFFCASFRLCVCLVVFLVRSFVTFYSSASCSPEQDKKEEMNITTPYSHSLIERYDGMFEILFTVDLQMKTWTFLSQKCCAAVCYC